VGLFFRLRDDILEPLERMMDFFRLRLLQVLFDFVCGGKEMLENALQALRQVRFIIPEKAGPLSPIVDLVPVLSTAPC
jgi:hypothetical protein